MCVGLCEASRSSLVAGGHSVLCTTDARRTGRLTSSYFGRVLR